MSEATMSPDPPTHDSPNTQHEESDVHPTGIALAAAGLVVVGVLVQFGSVWLFDCLESSERRARPTPSGIALQEEERLPPPPRLEGINQMEAREHDRSPLRRYSQEDARLTSYGWVDKNQGIAHIPIDQAMKLILQQHLLSTRRADQREIGVGERRMPNRANSGR